MDVRTIVVADKEELRRLYQQQVTDLGVPCNAVGSIHELYQLLQEIPCNGLLIDLSTSIRANNTEKTLLHDLQELFPVLRIKWDEQGQSLRCQIYGAMAGSNMSLATFLEQHCRPFTARRIRRDKRFPLHLSALISRDDNFAPEEVERSTTLDISKGGCLLLTTGEWRTTKRIWLRFPELADQTPIEAEIRHWIGWGTPRVLPTIGVQFVSLTESQQAQLEHPAALGRAAADLSLKR
jgi:hypothetical protein